MARKSRKTNRILSVAQESAARSDDQWETAAYARLSIENGGEDTDDTIRTQIALVEEYITEHEELKLVDTYVDNGYSGKNFHRPEFERMMDDIRKKKIRCIVVKDLSRFGRNYLEAGYYIETIFPFLGVRLIAVSDNFDSLRKEDVESLAIPIKNMVNAMYSKDISKKVYSAAHAKMRRAVPMSTAAPYGYIMNKEKEKYETDPNTAWCVKLIFHWKLEGVSAYEIAKRLNLADIPTSSQRQMKIGVRRKAKSDSRWRPNAINRILTHPVYTGAMVSGRSEQALFAGREKKVQIEPENWMITEGTHEPIISKEDFEKVMSILDETHDKRKIQLRQKESFRLERPDDLKDMVFCAVCGSQMTFQRKDERMKKDGNYYKCCGNQKGKICTGPRIPELLLKTLIMDEIFQYVDHICDRDKVLRDLCRKQNEGNPVFKANRKVQDAGILVESIRKKRERLYEDYVNGILKAEDYVSMNQTYMERLNEANENLETAMKEKQKLEQMLNLLHDHAAGISSFQAEHTFDKEMVKKLVDRIEVGGDKSVHVIFKFNDVFEEILNGNDDAGEGGTL